MQRSGRTLLLWSVLFVSLYLVPLSPHVAAWTGAAAWICLFVWHVFPRLLPAGVTGIAEPDAEERDDEQLDPLRYRESPGPPPVPTASTRAGWGAAPPPPSPAFVRARGCVRIALLVGSLLLTAPCTTLNVRRSWYVLDADRRVTQQLRERHPVVPREWGAFQSLEGSGYEVRDVFWDIGGVNGNLLLDRTAHFEDRSVPLHIEVSFAGLDTSHPAVLIDGVRTALVNGGIRVQVFRRMPLPDSERDRARMQERQNLLLPPR